MAYNKDEFQRLLPAGWDVTLFDLTESRDEQDLIEVVKGTHMLTLTQASDENVTILEACYFEYSDCGYNYLDTLIGDYTWPSELESGEALRWFARVVEAFEKDNSTG